MNKVLNNYSFTKASILKLIKKKKFLIFIVFWQFFRRKRYFQLNLYVTQEFTGRIISFLNKTNKGTFILFSKESSGEFMQENVLDKKISAKWRVKWRDSIWLRSLIDEILRITFTHMFLKDRDHVKNQPIVSWIFSLITSFSAFNWDCMIWIGEKSINFSVVGTWPWSIVQVFLPGTWFLLCCLARKTD